MNAFLTSYFVRPFLRISIYLTCHHHSHDKLDEKESATDRFLYWIRTFSKNYEGFAVRIYSENYELIIVKKPPKFQIYTTLQMLGEWNIN